MNTLPITRRRRRWLLLSASLATVLAATALVPMANGQEEVRQLVVDLDERTGPFRGAANGALYGLSDDGVPSDNTLEPLRISNVAQKPPAGAQHPNGDALVVADSFVRTGGDYVQIYVQDMYAQWTYENLGFEDYMEKLAWVVDQASQSPHAGRIVYVPFNEPDFIWYNLGTGNPAVYEQEMARFLDHWKTAVEYIREHDPDARVLGPNDSVFRVRNYGDFLTFARDNDVLPDFVSWHQLASSSIDASSENYFRDNYAQYRALEAERDIDPIPININEFAGNRDLTVPGQLVQWTAMLEEAKVDAGGKAYWTAAGGLAGDVVQTNKPGGGWWFYKMYADMHGGDTVKVAASSAEDAVGRVPGKFGNAIAPDGPEPNQYAELPDGILSGLTDVTIAAWVNWNGSQTWSRIFDFGSGTAVNMFLTPDAGGGSNGLRFAITTGGGGSEQQVTSSQVLPTGWQHVAVTLQGDTATIWLNGEELADTDGIMLDPADLGSTTQNWIGRSQYSDPLFDGAVDEFQIYDRALNQAEIASLLDSPGGTTGGGNVAWYRFDEPGGATALDSSGNGHDATIATVSGVDALEGIAVIDDQRRQARIVAGGTEEPFDVVVENVDSEIFGDTVNVRLSATTWSGQNSDAPPPEVLLDQEVAVEDGTVTVPVRGLGVHGDGGANVDRMAAYEIVLSPGGVGRREPVERPWRTAYEAEDATITAGQAFAQGTPQNWNTAAASGNRDVGALNQPDSAVTFDVDVPEAGEYRLSIMYGNQTGQPSQQVLTVNGGQARFVDYEATMNWTWRTRKDVVVELDAGTNQIRLAKSHPELGTAEGEATLDRIDLEMAAGDGPVTRPYEAELAQTAGDVTHEYDHPDQSGAGYVTLKSGSEALFAVYAEADGYYDVEFRHNSPGRMGSEVANVSLDRRPVDGAVLRANPGSPFWNVERHRLFLSAGINRIAVEPTAPTPVRLDRVSVTRATTGQQPVRSVEAEDATLSGSASVETHAYASGGEFVGFVGQGPDNRVTIEVEAERAGEHMLVVHYANDERDTGHPYNTDIISRPIDISVNGGEPTRHWFKNTWSWGNWWARGVPVTLEAGVNTIALYNDPANSATADGCPSPCLEVLDSVWAPNLDRFEIAPVRVDE